MNRIGNSKYHPPKLRNSARRRSAIAAAAKSVEVKRDESGNKSTHKPTRSAKKIGTFVEDWQEESRCSDVNAKYIIVHIDKLNELFSDFKCEGCKTKSLHVNTSTVVGSVTLMKIECHACGEEKKSVYSSPRIKGNSTRPPFQLHKVLVEAFTCLSLGYAGVQKFSLSVDISIMSNKSFNDHLKNLFTDFEEMRKKMFAQTREHVRKVYLEMNLGLASSSIIDYYTSYDGTYQTRGHTSHYGVGIVIEVITGLAVDCSVLSNYCYQCTQKQEQLGNDLSSLRQWQKTHKNSGKCQKNFEGPAGNMEVAGAEILWKRSIKEWNARYTTVLCDGDARTIQRLQELQVYGSDVEIVKEDCVNHVAKRMKTGLLNAVKVCSAKGITLGGNKKGALTKKKIDNLSSFYRNAIVKNAPNVERMKSEVLAPLEHYASTDQDVRHQLCPQGSDSWCWYNAAIAKGLRPPKHNTHPPMINETVIATIRPLYTRLSSTELLGRCTQGGTQNANESLHQVIWSKCSKAKFQSRSRLEMVVTFAICEFNMGCESSIRLKNVIQEEELSVSTRRVSEVRDNQRVKKSERYDRQKNARARRKAAKNKSTTSNQSYASGNY